MRLLFLCFVLLTFASTAHADPNQPPFPVTYEGCSENGNGLHANRTNNNPNAPGQDGRTRQGNNGKGNGGEVIDAYWYGYNPIPGNPATWVFTAIHYVCYSTESEDSEAGNWYINDVLLGTLPPTFSFGDELDPGML